MAEQMREAMREFNDPDVECISPGSIAAFFPDSSAWKKMSDKAMYQALLHRKGVLTRLCYLHALKNTKLPLLRVRAEQFRDGIFEPELYDNLQEWARFSERLPAMTEKVLEHTEWCQLLENEYVTMRPEWIKYWDAVEGPAVANGTATHRNDHEGLLGSNLAVDHQAAAQLTRDDEVKQFGVLLKKHCKTKNFLQYNIAATKSCLVEFYVREPKWYEMTYTPITVDEGDGHLRQTVSYGRRIEEEEEEEDEWTKLDRESYEIILQQTRPFGGEPWVDE